MSEKLRTNGLGLVEYIDNNPWLEEDGFSYRRDSVFQHKIEFCWTPNKKSFENTKLDRVLLYIDMYEDVNYDSYLTFYIAVDGKKSYHTHKMNILPMLKEGAINYDEESLDYSDIEANILYTMYNFVYKLYQ